MYLHRARYAGRMFRPNHPRAPATVLWFFTMLVWAPFAPTPRAAQGPDTTWNFAVSGDSRNCGDFVMPAIAVKAKAEHDAFYWHLGDFRWMSQPDQDLLAMLPAGTQLSKADYQQRAWDDFLSHQIASFGTVPVFLGRGNHEAVPPMTREGYIVKFSTLLDRPEITAQRKQDGDEGAPIGPWYHWVHQGVDFITLDNASHDEFSDAQLHWLRGGARSRPRSEIGNSRHCRRDARGTPALYRF